MIEKLLRAHKVALRNTQNGVVIHRGCAKIAIEGEGAANVIRFVMDNLARRPQAYLEFVSQFPASDHPKVQNLLDYLLSKRILYKTDLMDEQLDNDSETSLDVFYWELGQSEIEVLNKKSEYNVYIVGRNQLARRVINALDKNSGWRVHSVSSEQPKDNETPLQPYNDEVVSLEEYLDRTGGIRNGDGIVVVGCAFLNDHTKLKQLNTYCYENLMQFLPVTFDDLVCRIGPFVNPRADTPCLNCLSHRVEANRENSLDSKKDFKSFTGSPDEIVASYHGSLLDIVASIVAMEVEKHCCNLTGGSFGKIIEVRPLAPSITLRTVLKIPGCEVCSSIQEQPIVGHRDY